MANPVGQEREYLQKGSGSSLSWHVDQVCSCCCEILAGGKNKGEKDAFKIDKVKRRALFFSLLLSFLLCIALPRVRPLGESGEPLAPKRNRWPGCFGAGIAKSNAHPGTWPPVRGRPETAEIPLSCREMSVSPADHAGHGRERQAPLWFHRASIRMAGCPGYSQGPVTLGSACKCLQGGKSKKTTQARRSRN